MARDPKDSKSRTIMLRISPTTDKQLADLSDRLGLREAELCRVATSIGLAVLHGVLSGAAASLDLLGVLKTEEK